MGQHQLRIHNLHIVIKLDVSSRDRAVARLLETEGHFITRMHADGDVLHVQQDVDNVFLHAFHSAVLMHDAFDLNLGNSCTGN